PPRQPTAHVPDAPGAGAPSAEREPVAELSVGDERPFPPGDYPVVVVGSGAGAIQVSYSLQRAGVDHAVVSADPAPGGMFRRWTATRREEGADGTTFVLETTDGEYRAPRLIFAVGVAEPYSPATPGIELTAHYADTRPAETYAGRRIFIMGKQNSGFELATGL